VVRSVSDALELKAAAQKKRIRLDIAPGLPPVAGDVDQLHQVFQNLIDNAINYARSATEITVAVRPEADRKPGVVVTVTDRGEGIARHHLPRLTERFYRVDPARSRAVGGTGLGLAIVKHIVNRHRGRLEIDSEVGRGSTFSVHLPPADGTGEALGGTRAGWRAAS
jgi:two-component system phosphate regulon sensor histidine kinase PhoR